MITMSSDIRQSNHRSLKNACLAASRVLNEGAQNITIESSILKYSMEKNSDGIYTRISDCSDRSTATQFQIYCHKYSLPVNTTVLAGLINALSKAATWHHTDAEPTAWRD